jgi:hypothetical protein
MTFFGGLEDNGQFHATCLMVVFPQCGSLAKLVVPPIIISAYRGELPFLKYNQVQHIHSVITTYKVERLATDIFVAS